MTEPRSRLLDPEPRRRRKLSLTAIVSEAIDLVDESGLDALTMRGLARRLGVDPMAVYGYVESRNALLSASVRVLLSSVPVSRPDSNVDWGETAREMARAYRRQVHAHPRWNPLLAQQMASGISELPVMDAVIGVLRQAGFADAGLVEAYNAFVGGVAGFVSIELAEPPPDPELVAAELSEVDGSQYPALGPVVHLFVDRAIGMRWTGGHERPLDSSFDLLLDLLIDGLRDRAHRLGPEGRA
jgi:TetR/AcrR family transcriptional regulator, tetracycline repressor protein